MARHLIMGYYTCNLGHKHSTDNEMKECNRIEEESFKRHPSHSDFEETIGRVSNSMDPDQASSYSTSDLDSSGLHRQLRDHSLTKQNIENERIAEVGKMQKREIEFEQEKMRHEERLKEIELERLKTEKESKPPKSRVCVLS